MNLQKTEIYIKKNKDMETNYKLLEESVYINEVEHEVIFMYKDKKIIANAPYYIGSMGFDDLSIEIEYFEDYFEEMNASNHTEDEYNEIREIAEDLIYEMKAPYNEQIYHKRYNDETKTI